MVRICIAGATGWTGSALVPAVLAADDLSLTGAVSRSAAGSDIGSALGGEPVGVIVRGSVAEAIEAADVMIDYTTHECVLDNVLTAVERGVAVVIGTSGLSAEQFDRIDQAARGGQVGVIAAGNFSLTAAMALAGALLAAKHLPQWEIIDYASSAKPDAPSGTARELAERLAEVREPLIGRPLGQIAGAREARGATVAGSQIHSLRLPSFVVSTEVVFGSPDERLVIRHDAGGTPAPYVAGTLMAARAAPGRRGLTRGLDRLLLEG